MKKALKILGILIGIVVLFIVCGALYINIDGIPNYEPKNPDYKVTITPEKVERGKKLASVLCVHCHQNSETGKLTGREMLEAPQFGKLFSQNITHDPEYGIGKWTDGQILYLLRTGVLKDGRYSPPWMAKLPHMSDNDIESVIAFLRSEDPLVAAQAVPDKPCEPSFLAKFLSHIAFKPLPFPEKSIPDVDTTNKVALGKYLVFNLECFGCHSGDFKDMNVLEPEKTKGYLGGGNPIIDLDGKIIHSANITPDKETGIGNWDEAAFIRAVRFGMKENAPALRFPMLPFPELTDYEASAIYAYLKTIPPINHKVERNIQQ